MLGRMVEIKDMLGNHQIIRADGRKVDTKAPDRSPPPVQARNAIN